MRGDGGWGSVNRKQGAFGWEDYPIPLGYTPLREKTAPSRAGGEQEDHAFPLSVALR